MERFWNEMLDVERLADATVAFLPKMVTAIAILLLFWGLYLVTARSLRALLRRARFQEPLVRILVNNFYRLTVFVVAAIMAAAQLGINVIAALTGLGVAGIAVGFAAQDSLANIISGILIFWDKPFQVGDWLSVEGQYGQVTNITMRTTRIRTPENTYVVIPNKSIIDSVVVNHSKHGETRVNVPVGIAYKENIPEARRVLLEAVRGLAGVAASPAPDVVATGLGASSVDLMVRVWIEDAADERPVYFRVMEASKLALDAAGIEIPYHHLQLFVENVEDRVWQKAARLSAIAAGGGDGA